VSGQYSREWFEICQEAKRRDAEREETRTRQVVLARCHAQAAAAAKAWAGKNPSDEAVMWQRHCVDLALIKPAITIRFLQRGQRTADLTKQVGGVAFRDAVTIFVSPIVDPAPARDGAIVLHELGHIRTKRHVSLLDGEVNAWEWARAHAPAWPMAAQTEMVRAIQSYARTAKVSDLIALHRVECLVSPTGFAEERQRRLLAELHKEDVRFYGYDRDSLFRQRTGDPNA
jgi:hypothetical protein